METACKKNNGTDKNLITIHIKLNFLYFSLVYFCEFSCKNKKYLYLGQKLFYLGIFRLEFEKTLSYLKSMPSNFSKRKVWCKTKMPKLGTKNV